MPKWYVLRCMTGKETDVADRARGVPGVAAAIAPRRALMERRRGKWREVIRITFPGYVFVQCTLTPTVYYEIGGLPHAIRFLTMDGMPEAVPDNEMALVTALDNEGNPYGLSKAHVINGRYRIISGPMARLTARVMRVDARRGRATVEIPLLGEKKQVDLGITVTSTPNHTQA